MLTQRSLRRVIRRPRHPESASLGPSRSGVTSSPAPTGAVTMTSITHRSVGQTGAVSAIGRLGGTKPVQGVFGSLKKPRR